MVWGQGVRHRDSPLKHVFYLIYVVSYSLAMFVAGVFVGQWLERTRYRRELQAMDTAKGK